MSHTEETFDSSTKYSNQQNDFKKCVSLIDFIEDPNRTEPLVGLQYVVEKKISGSSHSIIKCDICCVKGHIKTMRDHLIGLQHIKAYMEMYYFSELQSIRRSDNRSKVVTLIKEFAREIERAEGTLSIRVEYISAAEMTKETDIRINEKNERYAFSNLQAESPFLDRRLLALQYSETFKISSRTEASLVLKLTQQLSDNLEQYFLKCKGLEILPAVVGGNEDSYTHLGLESILEKPVSKNKESASCSSKNASADSTHNLLEANCDKKQNQDFHSQHDDQQPSNVPGFQSRKRRKFEDPDQIPFISSSSVPHKYEESHKLTQVESSDVKTNSESKPSVSSVPQKKMLTNLSTSKCDSGDLDVTSTHASSHETPSNGQSQGKASKALSPDILQLLKGKDANTVTNILKTLSPFYSALQEKPCATKEFIERLLPENCALVNKPRRLEM